MTSKIQIRRDTAANWTATNPTLAQGEPGLETDTRKVKYGDGTTAWTGLAYASSGSSSSGSGDFASDWQDSVNDNVWRKVTVQGTKEFDFISEGYRAFEIELTTEMLADAGNQNLTFTSATDPLMADVVANWNRENNVWICLKSEFDTGNINTIISGLTVSGADNDVYTFSSNGYDFTTLNVGDKLTVKYWTEGTTYTGSYYDTYDTIWPDVSSDGAVNEVVIDTNEYPWMPWSDFLINVDKHSLTFLDQGKNILRNITNVVDNQDNTFTITFDGTPLQINTVADSSVTYTAIEERLDSWDLYVPRDVFAAIKDKIKYSGHFGTDNNKYTGNQQRSGYVIVNGGEPQRIYWNYNFDGNTGNAIISMADNTIFYSVGDTIELHYDNSNSGFQLDIYRPQTNNWNNGYRWFDWKEDLPEEYSPTKGNGVQAGEGKYMMRVYRTATDGPGYEPGAATLYSNFGWNAQGNYLRSPYDPYTSDNVSDWGKDTWNCYPMYVFDEAGIVFYSNDRYNDWAYSYKVRIMYEFECWIGEDTYGWFDC